MAEDSSAHLQAAIDRINAGDRAAQDELLRLAGVRLERLAHRMLQDFPRVRRWEDTGDLLQNAVMRLLNALRVEKVASARSFFRLAALQMRRELLDLVRHYYGPHGWGANHASPGQAGSNPSPANDPSDSTFDPGKLAVWTQFHQEVDALPEEEREVFDLLWYQDLTQAQAAAVLQVSVPTVKRRWLAARLRLRPGLHGNV